MAKLLLLLAAAALISAVSCETARYSATKGINTGPQTLLDARVHSGAAIHSGQQVPAQQQGLSQALLVSPEITWRWLQHLEAGSGPASHVRQLLLQQQSDAITTRLTQLHHQAPPRPLPKSSGVSTMSVTAASSRRMLRQARYVAGALYVPYAAAAVRQSPQTAPPSQASPSPSNLMQPAGPQRPDQNNSLQQYEPNSGCYVACGR
jgi:hypothetical protein